MDGDARGARDRREQVQRLKSESGRPWRHTSANALSCRGFRLPFAVEHRGPSCEQEVGPDYSPSSRFPLCTGWPVSGACPTAESHTRRCRTVWSRDLDNRHKMQTRAGPRSRARLPSGDHLARGDLFADLAAFLGAADDLSRDVDKPPGPWTADPGIRGVRTHVRPPPLRNPP